MSQQIIFPLLLLLIILKSCRQNGGPTAAEQKFGRSSRADRAAPIYRKHFETYGAQQMQRNGATTGDGGPTAPQRREGAPGTKAGRSRSRYMEFAETEFSRPSSYFPVPFVAPVDNRLQAIPARTLSQLIRQHIARNRLRQLAPLPPAEDNWRSAQSRVKELRQTPFRRWPSNSTVLSYAEKRRQWKAELKRRLKEQKVRPRIIPPLLISGGGYSSILTDREPESRYYVTYSPQTRTYQVSRHPPPFLYSTDRDALPQQLEEEPPQQIDAEPEGQQQETEQDVAEPSAAPPSHIVTLATDESNRTADDPFSVEETLSTALSTPLESTMPTSTTVRPPLLIILQNAELMPIGHRHGEHTQHVEAVKTEQEQQKPLKQILFLDDYEQVQDDEEGDNEMDNAASDANNGGQPLAVGSAPLPERDSQKASNGRADRGGGTAADQQNGAEEENEFEEEESEDEDMFFFKPSGGERRAEEQQHNGGGRGDPFRIVVHETGRKL